MMFLQALFGMFEAAARLKLAVLQLFVLTVLELPDRAGSCYRLLGNGWQ
jgi:hypothetical protein